MPRLQNGRSPCRERPKSWEEAGSARLAALPSFFFCTAPRGSQLSHARCAAKNSIVSQKCNTIGVRQPFIEPLQRHSSRAPRTRITLRGQLTSKASEARGAGFPGRTAGPPVICGRHLPKRGSEYGEPDRVSSSEQCNRPVGQSRIFGDAASRLACEPDARHENPPGSQNQLNASIAGLQIARGDCLKAWLDSTSAHKN